MHGSSRIYGSIRLATVMSLFLLPRRIPLAAALQPSALGSRQVKPRLTTPPLRRMSRALRLCSVQAPSRGCGIQSSPVSLPLRYAEGPEHFDCAQYKLRRGATGCYAMLAGRTAGRTVKLPLRYATGRSRGGRLDEQYCVICLRCNMMGILGMSVMGRPPAPLPQRT